MRNYDTIPLLPSVDKILSRKGGMPRGLCVEIFGPPGAGKTTLAMILAGHAQKLGLKVAWGDVENSLDYDYAAYHGFDAEKLEEDKDIIHFELMEDTLTRVIDWCNDGYGLVVIDSVTGLVPEVRDAEERIGDYKGYSPESRLMALAMSRICRAAAEGNTCVIFINQMRANIQKFGFGPKERAAGGEALPHYVSQRFEIRRVQDIYYGSKPRLVIGYTSRIMAHKNRKAPSRRPAYFNIIFDSDFPEERKKVKLEKLDAKWAQESPKFEDEYK
jgi:recombination protein RecA